VHLANAIVRGVPTNRHRPTDRSWVPLQQHASLAVNLDAVRPEFKVGVKQPACVEQGEILRVHSGDGRTLRECERPLLPVHSRP